MATVHLFTYVLIILHWKQLNLSWECCSCGITQCQVVEVTAMAEPSTAELQKELCLARFCLRRGPTSRWRDGLRL